MQSSRETKMSNGICLLLVLVAGSLHMGRSLFPRITVNVINGMLYVAALIIWNAQLNRRLIQFQLRKKVSGIIYLMLFWIAVRSAKYMFLVKGSTAARFAWYLYYVPIIFIPLLMFLAVLYIGRPAGTSISKKWNLLYIPSGLLLVGILTNDWHQLAFSFPNGMTHGQDFEYDYGVLYYGVIVWLTIVFLAVLVVVFLKSMVSGNRRKIWFLALPYVIGMGYTICYIFHIPNIFNEMFAVMEMCCILFCVFWETLLLTHLLPSNDSYEKFWNASSVGIGILDNLGNIRQRSAYMIPVRPEQVLEAKDHTVYLENGNIALRSYDIKGGFVYWTKDMSNINSLNRQLADLENVLLEENAMLDAENKLKKKRIQTELQNLLYDRITESVSSQLDEISNLLKELDHADEAEFEKTMKYACVLNAYVKRHSNLELLAYEHEQIDSGELYLAIEESLEYVRLYGINARCFRKGQSLLHREAVLLAYEWLEIILESAASEADAMLVNLDISQCRLFVQLEWANFETMLCEEVFYKKNQAYRERLQIETEQKTQYFSFRLTKEGEKHAVICEP